VDGAQLDSWIYEYELVGCTEQTTLIQSLKKKGKENQDIMQGYKQTSLISIVARCVTHFTAVAMSLHPLRMQDS
jgi:hypothetical protein